MQTDGPIIMFQKLNADLLHDFYILDLSSLLDVVYSFGQCLQKS